MVPITVPIPGTIVPAAPPRSAPEIVRFLSAQALVCSHRSAGGGLVLAGLVSADLVSAFMLLPLVFLEEQLGSHRHERPSTSFDHRSSESPPAPVMPPARPTAQTPNKAKPSGIRGLCAHHIVSLFCR